MMQGFREVTGKSGLARETTRDADKNFNNIKLHTVYYITQSIILYMYLPLKNDYSNL